MLLCVTLGSLRALSQPRASLSTPARGRARIDRRWHRVKLQSHELLHGLPSVGGRLTTVPARSAHSRRPSSQKCRSSLSGTARLASPTCRAVQQSLERALIGECKSQRFEFRATRGPAEYRSAEPWGRACAGEYARTGGVGALRLPECKPCFAHRHLTIPSSGQATAGCACFRLPLMSNVRGAPQPRPLFQAKNWRPPLSHG